MIVLYGPKGLLSFRLRTLQDDRKENSNPEKAKEWRDSEFVIDESDHFRVHTAQIFMKKENDLIQKVEVQENDLIFVLAESGTLYVLNSTLQNNEDGLIFKFQNPFFTSSLLDFYLPTDDDWLEL